MSAPPPPRPNGPPKPRGNPLRPNRRPGNPLVQKKKPSTRPTQTSHTYTPNQRVPNGPKLPSRTQQASYGGWSEPAPEGHVDIPLVMTKKALLDSMRFHVIKFSQAKLNDPPVDPTDQDAFARPVTLHRRDPRQPPPGRAPKDEAEETEAPQVDELEIERQAQLKAEKEAQKAIDQAKIAPVMKEANPKPKKKPKEEKTMFYRAPKTEAAKKESEVRYEEALPWHLEDADGKNVWVGSYISALSETTVAFVVDNNLFRMVPLQKWYKFTAKPPFQALTIDQAEALMKRKVDPGRWVMRAEEQKAQQADVEAFRRDVYGKGRMIKTESSTFKQASRSEKMEHDELDFSGDEFQDDDEAHTFEPAEDDDSKDAKDRIRREQLGANLFGEANEQEIDKELQAELREEMERRKYGKSTKKALIKRDREDQYQSDKSADNPWTSSSDDDSSDEEEEKKDDENKDPEAKDGDTGKAGDSKGSTPQKLKDAAKKGKSLKRQGSPALSDSSGNESVRKKIKKNATGTPLTGSRSGTPLPPGAATKKRKTKLGGAGSGSDGEATAGEMSDGANPKKKIKVLTGSSRGTPSASRAGSPNPRATSPTSPGPITDQEILDKIPPQGIILTNLIKPFAGRIGGPGQVSRAEWINMVKRLCEYGPDKTLRPRKR